MCYKLLRVAHAIGFVGANIITTSEPQFLVCIKIEAEFNIHQ